MLGVPKEIAFQEPSVASEETSACEDAFAELVHRQAKFVFRVAYSVLRNAHDSEDVVQETFLKLYRSRRYREIQDVRAYLARIAWRIAITRLSKTDAHIPGIDVRSERASPEEAAIAADWNAQVHRVIEALPKDLRLPLALSTVEELTSHEIAGIMGIPEGTVRRRVMRARESLKEKLLALRSSHGK